MAATSIGLLTLLLAGLCTQALPQREFRTSHYRPSNVGRGHHVLLSQRQEHISGESAESEEVYTPVGPGGIRKHYTPVGPGGIRKNYTPVGTGGTRQDYTPVGAGGIHKDYTPLGPGGIRKNYTPVGPGGTRQDYTPVGAGGIHKDYTPVGPGGIQEHGQRIRNRYERAAKPYPNRFFGPGGIRRFPQQRNDYQILGPGGTRRNYQILGPGGIRRF